MPISYKYKTIFIHIPKCAGTSIERILEINNQKDFYTETLPLKPLLNIENFTDKEYRLCASKNMQHYTYLELTKILSEDVLKNFKKIALVRNPYTRLVSVYHFHNSQNKDFDSFVKDALNLDVFTRTWLYDGHIETQSSYLINKEGNFSSIDHIFKFEHLEECFSYLENITTKANRPHLRKTDYKKPWQKYYSSEIKEFVFNFYREDFINFNYQI